MISRRKKCLSLFVFFICAPFIFTAHATTFYGSVKTGLLQLKDTHYPVYIYVPKKYKAKRAYAFLMVLPGSKKSPEKYIKEWTRIADKKNLIVVMPSFAIRGEDVPYRTDEWLLKLKHDLTGRYLIDKGQVYLIGQEDQAHYAAYLAVQYPREFTGAALLGGAWSGPLEKLMHFSKRSRRQVPVFVALLAKDSGWKVNAEKADSLAKKGYKISLKELVDNQEIFSDKLRTAMLAWLETESRAHLLRVEQQEKTLGEKTRINVEEFLAGR